MRKLYTNRMPSLPVITPYSMDCLGAYSTAGTIGSTTFGTNNLAVLYPWCPEAPTKLVKGFTVNGSAATGNIDVGVYDSGFNRLVSNGGAAQTGTNTTQELDITDTWFDTGEYWIAISGSSSSGTIYSITNADEVVLSLIPVLEATSAYPLPSTLTPTKSAKSTPIIACFGFTIETLV